MSNKLLAITLLLLLIVVTAVIYTKNQEDELPLTNVSLSFICENNQHFVAEFDIDFETLTVVENGEPTRQLSRVDETVMRFGDSNFEYTFAGEEARVLNKSTGENITCNQPFDPNNAPYNFGDLEAEEEQDATLAVRDNVVGTWVSLDDEKFEREFRSDGTVIDSYEGEETSSSTWVVFAGGSEVNTEFPQSPNTIYLSILDGTTPEEALYFSLSKLTPEELELIFMNRGGALRFSRVQ